MLGDGWSEEADTIRWPRRECVAILYQENIVGRRIVPRWEPELKGRAKVGARVYNPF